LDFFLGIDAEGKDLSIQGVVYGVLSSLFVALNSIYIKKIFPYVENNTWKLTLYNNVNAIFLFIPLLILVEWDQLRELWDWAWVGLGSGEWKGEGGLMFCGMLTLSGIFGIAISLVTMLQIKYTSPLTHNVSGTAKACAQTALAVFIHNESKSLNWWISNLMVLGSSAVYAQVRSQEMQRAVERAERDKERSKVQDV